MYSTRCLENIIKQELETQEVGYEKRIVVLKINLIHEYVHM